MMVAEMGHYWIVLVFDRENQMRRGRRTGRLEMEGKGKMKIGREKEGHERRMEWNGMDEPRR